MKIKTRRYYIYYFATIASFFIAILPLKLGLCLADLAGKVGFWILRKERKRAVENLKSAFPEKTDAEIERIAKKVFSNLSRNAVELINGYKFNKESINRYIKGVGFEKVDEALSKGKGVIILATHLGNWELYPFFFALNGYGANVIARRIYFDKYDRLLNKFRNAVNVNVVYRDESPKKFLKLLKDNQPVGLLADQDVDSVEGVFINFFGKPAYTPKAPVAFAMASKAPLIPSFMIRENGGYKLIFEDPLKIEKKADSNKEKVIKDVLEKWTQRLESYIRKYPDQWVWMHRRWKTTPEITKQNLKIGTKRGKA